MSDVTGTLSFDKEIYMYRYPVFLEQPTHGFKVTLISDEVFDRGMLSGFSFSDENTFIDLEFLYGIPFENDDQVVISESIALDVFDEINSVGQTIEINDKDFVVSGVIKDNENLMPSMYMSTQNYESLFSFYIKTLDIIIEDEKLLNKAYDIGGIGFVNAIEPLINQDVYYERLNTVKMIIFITMFVAYGMLKALTVNSISNRFNNETNKDTLKRHLLNVSKVIIFLLMYDFFTIASTYTFYIGFKAWLSKIDIYAGLLFIYIIPIANYLIKTFKQNKKTSS